VVCFREVVGELLAILDSGTIGGLMMADISLILVEVPAAAAAAACKWHRRSLLLILLLPVLLSMIVPLLLLLLPLLDLVPLFFEFLLSLASLGSVAVAVAG